MNVRLNCSRSRSIFDWDHKKSELSKLTKQSEASNFWDNPNNARQIMKTISDLHDEIEMWETLFQQTQSLHDLAAMEDESFRSELENEILDIEQKIDVLEFDTLLSGPYDKGNAILSINAGAGGTDAQDWAEMLERMYLRWAERSGFKTEIIHLSEGEEAGIKSITISISGKYAYGYLRAEKGVHRLVRLSPFDAAHRRHTSFVQVEVLPEVTAEDPDVIINPDDLEIDVYKSAGAGGQNVQKNATAIRIKHKPTGIVVTCQNERSQLQNKENAMKVLRGRLYEMKLEEQEKQIAKLKGEFQKIEWGSQIRSYVLHPYQMVKDHRTEHEEGNTQAVLDGDIDSFIQAYLKANKQ
ncbi:MAG TPA: peptide chain release factor 2 [Anaerolineaceae bacterium]|uniref:Peptide chain release factor 2 n=1 Tax=Anaerolinea thermophila TaxID=167964 RepID=A0A117LH25_9CHLR|nr:MAG: Peptide chain release factor 2 [Anaerolinea thermophila]HAF62254.1 peptide chain release factor 2 [Anaerolineaceae bacterium]